jgi:hypothetical protein
VVVFIEVQLRFTKRTRNDLFTVKNNRPGRQVQMSEGEVRALCEKSREIFLSQEWAQFSAEKSQSIDVDFQT